MFKLSFAGVVIRFYLMMAVVILAGFSGLWWLAILALPIFLSGIMAFKPNTGVKAKEAKFVQIEKAEKRKAI
jgi:hypothetical protein